MSCSGPLVVSQTDARRVRSKVSSDYNRALRILGRIEGETALPSLPDDLRLRIAQMAATTAPAWCSCCVCNSVVLRRSDFGHLTSIEGGYRIVRGWTYCSRCQPPE